MLLQCFFISKNHCEDVLIQSLPKNNLIVRLYVLSMQTNLAAIELGTCFE